MVMGARPRRLTNTPGREFAEVRDDDARADRVDPPAAPAPPHGLGHHPQRVRSLGQLIGVQRVRHLVRFHNTVVKRFPAAFVTARLN
jgi:hypothetical protein